MPTIPAAPVPPRTVPTATLVVFRLAALFTFLAVGLGAVVCATGSGASCPTWPGCRPGAIAPAWELSPLIEFTHRVVAMSAGPLVLAAALLSIRVPGALRRVRALPWLALAGALAAGAFGRIAVVGHLSTTLGGVDLFSALTSMASMATATVALGAARRASADAVSEPADLPRALAPLAGAAVATVVAMHVTGIFAAGTGSYTRCLGWPLWRTVRGDLHPALQAVRLGLAAMAAALVVAVVVVAVRRARTRRGGLVLAALFGAEMLLGLVIRGGGLDRGVAASYSALAAGLLWCLALLGAVAWSARTAQRPAPDGGPALHDGRELALT